MQTTHALVVIFLLTATATGVDPQYPSGQSYPLIAYIRADSRDEAEQVLPSILTNAGWVNPAVTESGVAGSKEDEGIRLARQHGASISVFVPPDAK